MKGQELLLTLGEVQSLLGSRVELEPPRREGPPSGVGGVLSAAAEDSAYQRFRGRLAAEETPLPVEISQLALVFGSTATAERTFNQVAEAAHLRTQVDDADVAVETVTGTGGLVSYWGFVQRGPAIVVLTLDTLSPQNVSIADLRSLVTLSAARLARLQGEAAG